MALRFHVTFDAYDPEKLARFWAVALDYRLQPPPRGYMSWDEVGSTLGISEYHRENWSGIIDPNGIGPSVFFQRVPEGKKAKNRVHLDVDVSRYGSGFAQEERKDVIAAHVASLRSMGAKFQCEVPEPDGYCVVLHDPEGNEFCVQ